MSSGSAVSKPSPRRSSASTKASMTRTGLSLSTQSSRLPGNSDSCPRSASSMYPAIPAPDARDVTVERVTITLADDKMMLRVEAEGRKLRQPFTIVASARGRPRYDPDRSALLFEPEVVTVENITIRGGSVAEKVEGATGRLKGRLGETLREGAAKIDAGAALIAERGIKAYLAAHPIYRLKDDAKGLVLRTLLRSIAIEKDTLVVTVSLWGLTLSAALWGLLLLGVAIFAAQLIRHPHWGLSPAFG
jgi:hypothetical protein